MKYYQRIRPITKDHEFPEKVKELLKRFPDELPIVEVQNWFRDYKCIAPRTFQWNVKEEIIPAPHFKGREGFYSKEEFLLVHDILRILAYLKDSNKVRLNHFRQVSKLHRKNLRELIDFFLEVLNYAPIFCEDEIGESLYYNRHNDEVWFRVFEKLRKGAEIKDIKLLDISDELDKEGIE